MSNDFLRTLCNVYKFERENPINKSQDEFKWYIWNVEREALREAAKASNEEAAEEHFKDYVRAKIDTFADVAFGGDASIYIQKYFNF